jgi:ABC-2 type transport system permease protein
MQGTIFRIALQRHWRGALGVGIGLGVLSAITLLFLPDMDALKRYQELFSTMPSGVLQAFGIDTTQALTPDTFVGQFLFARLVLFVGAWAVIAGLNISTNEEDDGIMDVVLALPVARWRIIIERFVAFVLLALLIVVLMFVGIFVGSRFTGIEYNLGGLFLASLVLVLPIVVMIALTAFLGAWLRRKSMVIAIAAIVIVTSYFVDSLGSAITDGFMANVRYTSFFAYADLNAVVMANGVNLLDMVVLLGLIAVLMGGALYFWQRRDVGI